MHRLIPRKHPVLLLVCCVMMLGVESSYAQALTDKVAVLLGDRHKAPDIAALESVAGGRDALMTRLKQLRLSVNPQLSYVSESLLIEHYSDDPAVLAALVADVEHPDRGGHAKLIAQKLSERSEVRIQREGARSELLGALLRRADHDAKVAGVLRGRLQAGMDIPDSLRPQAEWVRSSR